MYSHVLVSFVFVYIFSALMVLAIPVTPVPGATKSDGATKISIKKESMTKTENITISQPNNTETFTSSAENIVENLTESPIESETEPEKSNTQNNEDKVPGTSINKRENTTTTTQEPTTTISKLVFKGLNLQETKSSESSFNGLSFFEGILFAIGVIIISYGCYRYYKKCPNRPEFLREESYTSF